jgi:hypothetical protein
MLEVRKPDNCIAESVGRFHESSMGQNSWNVKYIIALPRAPSFFAKS